MVPCGLALATASGLDSTTPAAAIPRAGQFLGRAVARATSIRVPAPDADPRRRLDAILRDKGEHPAVVAALLELGADPNAENARGRTPLAVATSARFDRTAALLRAAGAR